MNKKAQIWISAVLYILITVLVLMIVIEFGTPLLENMKDKSIFTRTKDNFVSLDKSLKEISEEGYGSQRVIPIEIQKGKLEVSDNLIRWEMETNADIIEPGSAVNIGDLVISSNSDVSAKIHGDSIIMENSLILVNFSNYGNRSQWYNESIDLSKIINYVEYKTFSGRIRQAGTFSFNVKNNQAPLSAGNGYTFLEKEGTLLTEAKLLVHINSTIEYDLVFSLPSRADFLQIDVVNRRD